MVGIDKRMMKNMENMLLKFKCSNQACTKRDNYVDLSEIDAKKTKWLLYCGNCGWVYMTKQEIKQDDHGKWLPCIDYKGAGSNMTRGPVPDARGGIAWGVAGGNENISEKEFMERYGINPRIDWCKRSSPSEHPSYNQICTARESITPVEYTVPSATVGPHDLKPDHIPAHKH